MMAIEAVLMPTQYFSPKRIVLMMMDSQPSHIARRLTLDLFSIHSLLLISASCC